MDYRIEQLRYQLREDPSSRLFFQLGEILRREGQLDEAVEVLSSGLEVHPRYVAAWMALGKTLRDRGDSVEAEKAFSRALELDPENQVAARLIGESAVDRGEWTRAVKALKLARALGTRDDDLDERIEMVEGRLAALGLLEVEPPAVRPSAPATTPASAPVGASPPSAAMPVVSLSDDDPFSMSTGDDTGVWTSPEDPFGDDVPAPPAPEPDDHQATMPIPRSEIAAAVEQRAAEAPVVGPQDVDAPLDGEPAQAPDDDRPQLAEIPDIEAVAATAETITLPPRPASAPDATEIVEEFDAEDEDDATADEVPVPTLTLARLAVSQGDLELAERTLEGLLERVPDSAEAIELLEEVRRRRAGEPPSAPSIEAAQKIAALQRWLEAIRLAAERRTL